MKLSNIYNIKLVGILILSILLSSCSSSKMAEDEQESLSQEKLFMQTNFKEEYLKEWKNGDKFVCVANELPALLYPKNGVKDNYSNLQGAVFEYKGLEEIQTWKGYETNILFEMGNSHFIYKVSKPITDIFSSNFTPLLPEFVSYNYISKADSLLKERVVYIKTYNWYTTDGVEEKGRRLIPVTIQKVVAGNKIYPLSLIFKTDEGKEYMVYTTMYMSQYSAFDKLFSFTNPRDKYPQIKDSIWEQITQAKVTLGMTKDECSISLGLPNEVSQIPEYSGLRERWIYRTGTYLEFKDGLLVEFRVM